MNISMPVELEQMFNAVFNGGGLPKDQMNVVVVDKPKFDIDQETKLEKPKCQK